MNTGTGAAPAKMTQAQMAAKIAELEAAKTSLEAKLAVKRTISLKIGAKGGLSVYGLGRFPVTLYGTQWTELFKNREKIEQFLVEHASELAAKD